MKSLVAAVILSIVSVSCVTRYDIEYHYDGEKDLTDRELDRKLSKDLAYCEMKATYTHNGSTTHFRERAIDENVLSNCMYTRDWLSNYVEVE